jgi:hypothetical protein
VIKLHDSDEKERVSVDRNLELEAEYRRELNPKPDQDFVQLSAIILQKSPNFSQSIKSQTLLTCRSRLHGWVNKVGFERFPTLVNPVQLLNRGRKCERNYLTD